MQCVSVTDNRKYVRDFLSLPDKLYSKKENMESRETVRHLILGEHVLSKYFDLTAFVIYDGREAAGRFAITVYPGSDTAYIGLFECENNDAAAGFLFSMAEKICAGKGCTSIVGPVDASFWIKYRLKINNFDKPAYTGEPYNRDYYFDLFKKNGYSVKEHYTSSGYHAIDESYVNEKFEERFKAFEEKGYRIESVKHEGFEKAMMSVYDLITDLYSDFPVYSDLSREDFMELFNSYRSIMDMSMTKLAYYGDETVGFYISIPDYGNIVYHLNPVNILRLLRIRKKPKRYVMLYMGVDREHRGLGKALVYAIMKELEGNRLPSIGALARDGKVTQTYAAEEIEDIYEYVLLEHRI